MDSELEETGQSQKLDLFKPQEKDDLMKHIMGSGVAFSNTYLTGRVPTVEDESRDLPDQ